MEPIFKLSETSFDLFPKEKIQAPKLTGSESFKEALQAAKNLIEVNRVADADTTKKTLDFMTGDNDNIVDLMVAQTKSSILLNYGLQVRSGLLNSYKEITNIQI